MMWQYYHRPSLRTDLHFSHIKYLAQFLFSPSNSFTFLPYTFQIIYFRCFYSSRLHEKWMENWPFCHTGWGMLCQRLILHSHINFITCKYCKHICGVLRCVHSKAMMINEHNTWPDDQWHGCLYSTVKHHSFIIAAFWILPLPSRLPSIE